MSATEQHTPAETEAEVSTETGLETPPAGEEIHLPGPSFIPIAMAAGITLTVIGTTIDWLWSAIGLIIFITTLTMWIRDVRRDVAALPEEHHH